MKRLLPLVIHVFLVALLALPALAQRNTQSELLNEDFDGLTNLPAGWVDYTTGWNMIVIQSNAVMYFQQENTNDPLILSTPELDLTNATQLTFDFQSPTGNTTLKVGTMTDPTDPSTFQLLATFQPPANFQTFTVALNNVDAVTHISFYWLGSFWYTANLDNVLVVDDQMENNVPAAVSNLLLVPAPMGGNSFDVSWTNPTQEADGGQLTDLDSVVLGINGARYQVILNPVIGGNELVTIPITTGGFFVASVTPYNTAGEGATMQTEQTWAGLDVPAAPKNIVLNSVGPSAILQWEAPDTGAHGGYFDGIIDHYDLMRADTVYYTIPGTDTTYAMEITDPGTFNFDLTPVNASGSGLMGKSNARAFLTGDYLLWEDFWVSVPALDWTVQGQDEYNWWFFLWNLSGGGSPEMWFQKAYSTWSGVSRMVSPVINTYGISSLRLSFWHSHSWLAGTYDFKVQTTSDGGTTWHDAWVLPVSDNRAPAHQILVINNSDVGSPNFQFAMVFSGNVNNVDYIAMDEIHLNPAAGVDLAALDIVLPQVVEPGDNVTPRTVVQSLSANATSYDVTMKLVKDGSEIYSNTVSTTIASGGTDTIAFPGWLAVEGEVTATAYITCGPDNNNANDTIFESFGVYDTYPRDLVILEEGTGTWCTYCPGASMGIEDLIAAGKPVAAVAYHDGDSFTTDEGDARIIFYGMTGFPTVMFDGIKSYVGGTHSQSMYGYYLPFVENRMLYPSPVHVEISDEQLNGDQFSATVNISSKSPIHNDHLVLQAVLTESNIPYEWQDQTELHKVERSMFQGSQGTTVDLSGQTADVEVTFTIDPAWVLGELQLVAFVQDTVTKEVFNGAKKVSLGVPEVPEGRLLIWPNPASTYVLISLPRGMQSGEVTVFDLFGRAVQNTVILAEGTMDVSALPPGLYLLRITTSGKEYQTKLIISR